MDETPIARTPTKALVHCYAVKRKTCRRPLARSLTLIFLGALIADGLGVVTAQTSPAVPAPSATQTAQVNRAPGWG